MPALRFGISTSYVQEESTVDCGHAIRSARQLRSPPDPVGNLTAPAPQEATGTSMVRWWRMNLQVGRQPEEAYDEIRSTVTRMPSWR
jgi:hypothetical protein